ncbi:hypothetical protein GWK41_00690 [Persephonella atlantica]|uniref:Response regulatory domain-containing protein n=1 Tax=Persephonella atlantica TaxID=2699429 RepID=A0ABS1GF62_9AQUI|nr:hypothetical protein [Persephonella atlantica]MBK3331578.1 hypothetical protein [Persephonella atlantica]
MNIAIISFDQDLVTGLAKKLPDFQVKGYTDSLSLLREISFFDPEIIIYDATGGDLAFNALEFFLSREQVKGKKIKVLISKDNPIDDKSLSQFSSLDFYDKETELEKLVQDIKETELEEATVESFEENYQPPTDMEALLATENPNPETEEIDLSMETEGIEDVNELLKEMESISVEETAPPKKEEKKTAKTVKEETVNTGGTLKITVEISPEDIRETVLKTAVEKLIEEIKSDIDIQKIKEDLQKDFFDRLEKELKDSAEEIKENIKNKIFESIESELKEKVKESIKEDVTRITTELVKEKLNQVFGSK